MQDLLMHHLLKAGLVPLRPEGSVLLGPCFRGNIDIPITKLSYSHCKQQSYSLSMGNVSRLNPPKKVAY